MIRIESLLTIDPTDPYGDDDHRAMMNHPYANRTPSPLTGYQLADNPNPYAPQGHLGMPSSDRLAEQPTVSPARVRNMDIEIQ